MASLSSLFVRITVDAVIASTQPFTNTTNATSLLVGIAQSPTVDIPKSTKIPRVDCVIISESGTQLQSADCSYVFENGSIDVQFDLRQLASHLICPGDNLLQKLQMYYLSLSSELREKILQDSPYPGSDEISRFINTFVGGYVNIIFTTYLMSLCQQNINEPFYPLLPIIPLVPINYLIVSKELCSYLHRYIWALRPMQKSLCIKNRIGSILLQQSDDFCFGYLDCLPDKCGFSEKDIDKRYCKTCFDESIAIYSATISFACYFESRTEKISQNVESIDIHVENSINSLRSEVNATESRVSRSRNDMAILEADITRKIKARTEKSLAAVQEQITILQDTIDHREDEWRKMCSEQMRICVNSINEQIDNKVSKLSSIIEQHKDQIKNQRRITIQDIAAHVDVVIHNLRENSQNLLQEGLHRGNRIVETITRHEQKLQEYFDDIRARIDRVNVKKVRALQDRMDQCIKSIDKKYNQLLNSLHEDPETKKIMSKFTNFDNRLAQLESGHAYDLVDDAVSSFEQQATNIAIRLQQKYLLLDEDNRQYIRDENTY